MGRAIMSVIIILGLALVAAIVYGLMVTGDRNNLQAELGTVSENLTATRLKLQDTEAALASTGEELKATGQTLAATQANLETTQENLTSTQAELRETEDELSATSDELADAKLSLYSAERDIASLQDELDETLQRLTDANDTLDGLGITVSMSLQCYDAALIDNDSATNPTWSELKAFLAEDRTEDHEYIIHEYDCSEFSRDLHNRAEAAGIKAAEVQIQLEGEEYGHALNAFLTTDYGLVYIDCLPASDKIVRVKVGQAYRAIRVTEVAIKRVQEDLYWQRLLSYWYFRSSTGEPSVVSDIRIYW